MDVSRRGFDNSAMDGYMAYATNIEKTGSENSVKLFVAEDIPAS